MNSSNRLSKTIFSSFRIKSPDIKRRTGKADVPCSLLQSEIFAVTFCINNLWTTFYSQHVFLLTFDKYIVFCQQSMYPSKLQHRNFNKYQNRNSCTPCVRPFFLSFFFFFASIIWWIKIYERRVTSARRGTLYISILLIFSVESFSTYHTSPCIL